MMRLPRFLPSLAIACVVSSPLLYPDAAHAQEAAAVAPLDKGLVQDVEDFFHYASIARYEQAREHAEKILGSGADPREVKRAFEQVAAARSRIPGRESDPVSRLLVWERNEELKEVSGKLQEVLRQADQAVAADIQIIEQNIRQLGDGPRPYQLALMRLKDSGELAVPVMLSYLRDAGHRELHVPIRQALVDLRHRSVVPLMAATEMKDWDTLTWVISALGDLGEPEAIPALARVLKGKETPDGVRNAAARALSKLGVKDIERLSPVELLLDQAERFYYEKTSLLPPKGQAVAFAWYWTDQTLTKKDVPAAVYNEVMALRAAESVLKLDPSRGEAVSLWLAAAYKREAELPEGQVDPTWAADHPNTHYYAVASGTQHLNPTLDRALRDRNAAVAIAAIKSLQEIAGASNLLGAEGSHPVIDALRYPDRRVRFEAAFAIAQSLPQKAFAGQERVVPILAEAVAQSGQVGVLVLADSQDALNQLTGTLEGTNYVAKGGTTADAAIAAAAALKSIDVILVREGDREMDRLLQQIRNNLRLERAAKLVVVGSKVASPMAAAALNDPLLTLTDASMADQAALSAAIEEARSRAGGLPVDPAIASEYSLRASAMLQRLSISRGQVLDLSVAELALFAALDDARADVATAASNALGYMDAREAQPALLARALDAATSEDLKTAFLKNLAINARFYGNRLEGPMIEGLTLLLVSDASLEIRSAAAEAHGALNLAPDQVKTLIVNQAK